MIKFLFFSIFILGACTNNKTKDVGSNQNITYLVNGDNEIGFSYQILRSGKLFIDQVNIPAVGGTQLFKTKEQAEDIAILVVKKMRNSSEFPAILTEELDSLNIEYTKP